MKTKMLYIMYTLLASSMITAPAYAIACNVATDTKLLDCAIVCTPMTIGGWPWGVAAYGLCL